MQLNFSKEEIREIFLDNEKNCSLCGGKLKFLHSIDHINKQVMEESYCKSCGIRHKKRNFGLQ